MGAAETKLFLPVKIIPEAVAAQEDDNLLSEILLCMSPLPSSLPCASAVCKRWHSLATDRGFIRRFRLRHRDNPPLLGYYHFYGRSIHFEPTMEPPNRVPRSHFFQINNGDDRSMLLGCRHGLVLIWHYLRADVGHRHRQQAPHCHSPQGLASAKPKSTARCFAPLEMTTTSRWF